MTGKIEQWFRGPDSLDWSEETLAWAQKIDAEIEALTRRVDEEREAKHKVMAEAWALTRRNAELTRELSVAEISVRALVEGMPVTHPEFFIHSRTLEAIRRALTPTESEAK